MTQSTGKRKFTRVMWTAEEEAYLRLHYADSKTQAIADHLGRSLGKIYAKADYMNLNKSPAFMASEASGRMKRPLHGGMAHWFKPGHTSHNKGKKDTATQAVKKAISAKATAPPITAKWARCASIQKAISTSN